MSRARGGAAVGPAPERSPARRYDVAVIGSGFAGSLVAWGLQRQGLRTVLLERGAHPRTVLGESTTPLANLALERLAVRLDSEALWNLAAWGRWRRHAPELRCGLKRGFSFYRHRPGEPLRGAAAGGSRLLVAASPDDEVADTQWDRAAVDAFLVDQAAAAGVCYLDRTEIGELEVEHASQGGGWCLEARRRLDGDGRSRRGETLRLRAGFLVDASGGGGFLERRLRIAREAPSATPRTHLLASHFGGVEPLAAVAETADGSTPPFDETWSAVHQLIDEGWMYQLRFDDGWTSAGFVLTGADRIAGTASSGVAGGSAGERFAALLRRYPSLAAQFSDAASSGQWFEGADLAFRLRRAHGAGFLLLPQAFAFFDPLYSTGIAWSLLAVERVLDLFAEGPPPAAALERYGALLEREADHVDRLIGSAYRAMAIDRDRLVGPGGVETLALTSRVYFVAASFQETVQRLFAADDLASSGVAAAPPPARADGSWAWRGLLGADDALLAEAARRWYELLGEVVQAARGQAGHGGHPRLRQVLGEMLAARDVAGLSTDPEARSVGVDLEALVGASDRLGCDPATVRWLLPR
ncbi:MAG: FAD-dependent oxidoreductase, partial [Acidobacteria bacterium]